MTVQPLLSVVRSDRDRCQWLGVTPGRPEEPLALVPLACSAVTVAVASHGALFPAKALLQLGPEAQAVAIPGPGYPKPAFAPVKPVRAAAPTLWQITLPPTPAALPYKLAVPQAGTLERAGFDSDGSVQGLTLVSLEHIPKTRVRGDDGEWLERFTVDGNLYETPALSEGQTALAMAFSLGDNGKWHKTEDKPTSIGWSYGLGVDVLDAAHLWARGEEAAGTWETLETDPKKDRALLQGPLKLAPKVATGSNDGFIRWRSSSQTLGEILVWQASGEFAKSTGLILFRAPGAAAFAPLTGLGYTAADLINMTFDGDFLLVTTLSAKSHPRLFDMHTGKLLYESDRDLGVTFWRHAVM